MNLQAYLSILSNEISRRLFCFTRPDVSLPQKRVLITADLDEPVFDPSVKQVLELLAGFQIPLTLFAPNTTERGKESYPVLEHIGAFASGRNLAIEFASHSVSHTALPKKNPREAASIIEESISGFRKRGIPVHGFRSPYLSTERQYRMILQELGSRDSLLQYDSSALLEGSFFVSRLHDILNWKSPHCIAGRWELPISCLDDYHLFERSGVEEQRVLVYWKNKVDRSLSKYSYFLLLIHPHVIGKHLGVLENLIAYCRRAHEDSGFVTCGELVDELDGIGRARLER